MRILELEKTASYKICVSDTIMQVPPLRHNVRKNCSGNLIYEGPFVLAVDPAHWSY